MKNQELTVKREGAFSYPICLRENFNDLATKAEETGFSGRKACVVSDSRVFELYGEEICEKLRQVCSKVTSFVFPAGEEHKNLDTIEDLYEHLIQESFDRKDFLVALGGGVTGDMAGYAAATYLRGIDFIQVPTTLLAQVDSSIGGKTGVDFRCYKNMVGAFHQPRLVYMNLSVLRSLPDVEFACGMGEVIKSALICDRKFYDWLSENADSIERKELDILEEMVYRCCDIKRGIVERDPTEKGERALLNLGHTIGHAIEKQMNFQLHHGQCVGLGLLAAAGISRRRGLLTPQEEAEIRRCCQSFHLPVKVKGLQPRDVLAASKKDKKMEHGKIKFILMKGLGHTLIDKTVTDQELLDGIADVLDAEK